MAKYYDTFSLSEKLYEYGVLSARKKAIEEDLLKYNEVANKMCLFEKLKLGNIDNVISLSNVVDEMLKSK